MHHIYISFDIFCVLISSWNYEFLLCNYFPIKCNILDQAVIVYLVWAVVSSEEEFLKLVHYYGPCSPRIWSMEKQMLPLCLKSLNETNKEWASWHRGSSMARTKFKSDWSILNFGLYVVNVGLGTPKREFTLLIDTGSSLIWTQCRPCKLGNLKGCYKQRHPIFDPSTSSTYTNITCPSQICSLANTTLLGNCVYYYYYYYLLNPKLGCLKWAHSTHNLSKNFPNFTYPPY